MIIAMCIGRVTTPIPILAAHSAELTNVWARMTTVFLVLAIYSPLGESILLSFFGPSSLPI
jgi:hypothetical protein